MLAAFTVPPDSYHPARKDCSCRLCGTKAIPKAFEMLDAKGRPASIYSCPKCLTASPRYENQPEDGELVQNNLREMASAFFPEDRGEWEKAAVELRQMVRFYSPLLQQFKSLPVGEVGSGRGCLLAALKSAGYQVRACEPSGLAELSRKCFGFGEEEVQPILLEEFCRRHANTFGVIFAWHVLEHLPDPLAAAKALRGALVPGGALLFQIPLLAQKYLEPQHFTFMSEPSLEFLAAASSFGVEAKFYDFTNHFLTAIFRRKES
jgi:SAM-dependent methyltransferase